jgi:hypothetical protein
MFARKAVLVVAASFVMVFSPSPRTSAQQTNGEVWRFAVSGDSRNCGDVIMPAIARMALKEQNVSFYWHLGDYRFMAVIDDDMKQRYGNSLTLADYQRDAWGDFLANQIAPFGMLPVHLGIGNHELYGSRTEADYLKQFAYWLDSPDVRAQRASGDLQIYHHWKQRGIDFLSLDNAADSGFDDQQVQWFEKALAEDKADPKVTTVVVGMHQALPNSFSCGHSMNASDKGTASGRHIYTDLVNWKRDSNKFVYVLASHSHFFMEDIFDTDYWKNPAHGGVVLPGWIIGTAGAQRYAMPNDIPPEAKARTKVHVSGYLLGTVQGDGSVAFNFREVTEKDLPASVKTVYGEKFVQWCFAGNTTDKQNPLPPSCLEK